jgi:hypothetical protein
MQATKRGLVLRRFILALAVLLACGSAAAASGAPQATTVRARSDHKAVAYYTKEIGRLRRQTWYWQRVMGVQRTPIRVRTPAAVSVTGLRRLAGVWRDRSTSAARKGRHPPHLREWLCIHRYEGSWRDGGAPYYGGLQMDLAFQQTYGDWLLRAKGTADHWSPLEQIWTAVRAARVRGFYPWPNTARVCGLL